MSGVPSPFRWLFFSSIRKINRGVGTGAEGLEKSGLKNSLYHAGRDGAEPLVDAAWHRMGKRRGEIRNEKQNFFMHRHAIHWDHFLVDSVVGTITMAVRDREFCADSTAARRGFLWNGETGESLFSESDTERDRIRSRGGYIFRDSRFGMRIIR